MQDFSELFPYPIFCGTLIFTYLANFKNKIPTLWWGEVNLIGRLFVVGSKNVPI